MEFKRYKRYFFICSISTLLGLCFAVASHAYGNNEPVKAKNVKPADFSKQPVEAMKEIYKNYHDWKIDQGIESAKKALGIVNKTYEKDINGKINDLNLKKSRAFEIKSTLHTLLGMLYYRKSLMSASESNKKISPYLEKTQKGKGLSDKDIEQIAEQIKKDKSNLSVKTYFDASRNELQTAIQSDTSNPAPHFQLGLILSPAGSGVPSAEAEKEFFTAAKLSLNEGDPKSAERAIDTLKKLNSKSDYIKQYEKLAKGAKNVK